jgi:PAS domain S-box-containing protein
VNAKNGRQGAPAARPSPSLHGGHREFLLTGKVLSLLGVAAAWLVGVVLVTLPLVLRQRLELVLGGPSDSAEGGTFAEETLAANVGWIDRVVTETTMVVGAALVAGGLLSLFFAWWVVRRAVQPLKQLVRAVDQVATGVSDPAIEGVKRVNCWEIRGCTETQCEAYMNLDQPCWYIDGTPCEGHEPSFPEKLHGCRQCEVYRAHRGDEIRQLVDAFKHMIGALQTSREELLRSGDLQTRLIRNSYNGVIATDADGLITIFNRAAEGILQVPAEEVIGKEDWTTFFDRSLERDLDRPLSYERIRRVRGFRLKDSVIHTLEGEPITVVLSGISLFDRGRHVGRVFFFQDMREVRGLKEELIRSERLAATGQAAAGISHSVKNILDGFRGGAYVYSVGRAKDDREKMDKGWEMVERNMEIISRLVLDLLNFAKDRDPQLESVAPRTLIESVLADLGIAGGDRIEVVVDVEQDSGHVELDPHTFQQCLGNLIRNAAEAIPSDRKGQVTIGYRREGKRATFTVRDDGIGMSEDTIQQVKGGMYSTKGSKGTGLGLLVTQKIIDEHDGTLTIESREGEGALFRIDLPQLNEPCPSTTQPAATTKDAKYGKGRSNGS